MTEPLYDHTPPDDGLTCAAEGALLLGALGIVLGALAVSAALTVAGWALHHTRR